MILVTTGTNEQPFDRLVRAAAALDVDERLVVQYGSSRVAHGRGEWIDFVTFDELAALAAQARIVVCHAGVGSIMLARRSGHRPVVMARRHHLNEAVDDHQVALARRLAKSSLVTLVEDETTLASAVATSDDALVAVGSELSGAKALTSDVRALLTELGAPRISARAA